MKYLKFAVVLMAAIAFCVGAGDAREAKKEKDASFSGRVFRSDTKAALAKVKVELWDEKKSGKKEDNSQETVTDAEGKFSFATVKPGKYTISIQAPFEPDETVPCQFLMGKIDEPNSTLLVITQDDGKRVEQVFIKGFNFKEGKEVKKEFDLVCKSLFGG
jgi:hypothetical protein